MLLRMLANAMSPIGHLLAGQVYDVPDGLGQQLLGASKGCRHAVKRVKTEDGGEVVRQCNAPVATFITNADLKPGERIVRI